MDTAAESPSGGRHEERTKGGLFDWLDAIAKLLGAGAIVAVAVAANMLQSRLATEASRLQSRLTGISLQSQREQADTQLRANMFNSLISPLFGSAKDGKSLPPVREELLAELLALNFSEDFELRPIMEDVDKQLRKGGGANPSLDLRWPLWSVARRVADRQISSLSWKWTAEESDEHGCEVFYLYLKPEAPECTKEDDSNHKSCVLNCKLKKRISLNSPDGNYNLQIVAKGVDRKNQTIDMSIAAKRLLPLGDKENEHNQPITYQFTLDMFNFPLTDNTVLPGGNRFAFTLILVDEDTGDGQLKVIWFPKGYFTQRERPLDPQEILRLLGGLPHT
jgi:hypothetical protein